MAASLDWTFAGTWPFEPRWFETADGKLHYVDEGPREVWGRVLICDYRKPINH